MRLRYDVVERHYDLTVGRFLQNDPVLGNRASEHYGYAGGNPVSNIDPMGTYWKTVGDLTVWVDAPESFAHDVPEGGWPIELDIGVEGPDVSAWLVDPDSGARKSLSTHETFEIMDVIFGELAEDGPAIYAALPARPTIAPRWFGADVQPWTHYYPDEPEYEIAAIQNMPVTSAATAVVPHLAPALAITSLSEKTGELWIGYQYETMTLDEVEARAWRLGHEALADIAGAILWKQATRQPQSQLGRTTGGGVVEGRHNANMRVIRGGRTVFYKRLVSGNMTAEEAALGFPKSTLATHTEVRGLNAFTLQEGDVVVFTGQLRPCPPCKGVMRSTAEVQNITIKYRWRAGGKTEQKTWWGK